MSARAPCPDDCPHCRRNTALMGIVEHARLTRDERTKLLDGIYDRWSLAHGLPLEKDDNEPEGGT